MRFTKSASRDSDAVHSPNRGLHWSRPNMETVVSGPSLPKFASDISGGGWESVDENNAYKEVQFRCGCSLQPCLDHNKRIYDATRNLARASLPAELSHIQTGTFSGIFTNCPIDKFCIFGPLIAPLGNVADRHHGDDFCGIEADTGWREYSLESDVFCNWMRNVRRTSDVAAANLVAFQRDENIYFAARCNIALGAELVVVYARVWESDEEPTTAATPQRTAVSVPIPQLPLYSRSTPFMRLVPSKPPPAVVDGRVKTAEPQAEVSPLMLIGLSVVETALKRTWDGPGRMVQQNPSTVGSEKQREKDHSARGEESREKRVLRPVRPVVVSVPPLVEEDNLCLPSSSAFPTNVPKKAHPVALPVMVKKRKVLTPMRPQKPQAEKSDIADKPSGETIAESSPVKRLCVSDFVSSKLVPEEKAKKRSPTAVIQPLKTPAEKLARRTEKDLRRLQSPKRKGPPPLSRTPSTRVCEICGWRFSKTILRDIHMTSHGAALPEGVAASLSCPVGSCRYRTDTLEKFMAHNAAHRLHPPEKRATRASLVNRVETEAQKQAKKEGLGCVYCGLKCRDHLALREHVVEHTVDGQFPCRLCQKPFASYIRVRTHLNDVHFGVKSVKCQICGIMTTPIKVKQHMRMHSTAKEFECAECGHAFKMRHYLERHMLLWHDPMNPRKQKSRNSTVWLPNSDQQYKDYFFKCLDCKVGFLHKRNCLRHFNDVHPDKSIFSIPELNLPSLKVYKYRCTMPACKKTCPTPDLLRDHHAEVHSDVTFTAEMVPAKKFSYLAYLCTLCSPSVRISGGCLLTRHLADNHPGATIADLVPGGLPEL